MKIQRKKLIEVSLPLKAINAASAKEKSIRHGHPSTLHLWWARRPLATCRAVLFAQLVDDPSAWPEDFPTEEAQARERQRLHGIIERMVPWTATRDERVLGEARYEIARSLARGRGESPPNGNDSRVVLDYLAEHAPPVCDPFCGGGSIPLEAQRLGLRAHGSDLNPVAVLVSKATCEIPPKFAGRAPVHPDVDETGGWSGASGLAEDIRRYGKWMRDEAEARIGHLYPKVQVTEAMAARRADLRPYIGQDLTVIAWLWARTVASPDPMLRGAHVPLANSFVLSSKRDKEAIVAPIVDRKHSAYRFTVKADDITPDEYANAKKGTKVSRGSFRCVLSGTPIPYAYADDEANAGRMRRRLMAIVAKAGRRRVFLSPRLDQEETALSANPEFKPGQPARGTFASNAQGRIYGFKTFGDYFTDRQLVALTTFSDFVAEARERVLADALATGMDPEAPGLADGGTGAQAYADAVATYLGLGLSRMSDICNASCRWESSKTQVRNLFGRQAIPMVWDYAEPNIFSESAGDFGVSLGNLVKVVERQISSVPSAVIQRDAAGDTLLLDGAVVATDPPYYDNVGYADLSDFFYVWQRRTLRDIWPDLYRRVLVPKGRELVATPHRHGGRDAAEQFFIDGMGKALRNMHASGQRDFPVTMYYAFKQAEVAREGLTSPGWATFLQAVFDAGYVIYGTWPVRTELSNRPVGLGTNALASSIVLVCRKRPEDAPANTRREFVARLRSDLPDALEKIREGGVGPVDMAQAAIGPGMGIFTAASRVLEPDDTPMSVRTAIALINQVRDEISGEEATSYDRKTRFCIEWFEAFEMDKGKSGDAITMAQAYDIGIDDLQRAGVFRAQGGQARLLGRDELPATWDPKADKRLTDWECAQHLARVLESPKGGVEAAARLYSAMAPERSEAARMLAYRLYDICERKKRAAEAQVWNMLAQEWPAIESALARLTEDARQREETAGQGSFEFGAVDDGA